MGITGSISFCALGPVVAQSILQAALDKSAHFVVVNKNRKREEERAKVPLPPSGHPSNGLKPTTRSYSLMVPLFPNSAPCQWNKAFTGAFGGTFYTNLIEQRGFTLLQVNSPAQNQSASEGMAVSGNDLSLGLLPPGFFPSPHSIQLHRPGIEYWDLSGHEEY